MAEEDQITRWNQRLLRSKLHLPRFAGTIETDHGPMAEEIATPLCGRQLNNHRAQRSQLADKIEFAQSVEEFTYQLLSGKVCTHCAMKSGLLVKPKFVEESEDDED